MSLVAETMYVKCQAAFTGVRCNVDSMALDPYIKAE